MKDSQLQYVDTNNPMCNDDAKLWSIYIDYLTRMDGQYNHSQSDSLS